MMLPAAALAAEADLAAAPRAVMEQLYAGEYQQVFDQSTEEVQQGLGSGDTLAAMWAQLAQMFGEYQGITSASAQEQAGMVAATVVCSYALANVTFSVVLTADGLLAGLTVAGVEQKAPESSADATQFVSEPIVLRAGAADETQGLLTLPLGDGPFPAVILMQGSGPSDMHETAYGITPLRDLSEGLALLGIASIRYDKYSYAHADLLQADPALLAAFTVQQEYIDDAQAALALLQADSRIGNVYLLGHSQGGMILPRVMQALGADAFAGGIILEGSPLALWEIQYHQNLALVPKMEEMYRDAAVILIDQEAAKAETLADMTDDELKAETLFGLSAYYQKDQMAVDAAETANALGKPLFITQGGKDWQVTPTDGMDAWKDALDKDLPVTYQQYPDMNHMLCELEGEPAGDTTDYQAGSTVSQALIADIAAWILAQ
jgi:hypothetical protein